MTLIDRHGSPLEQAWVALDLETTGLSPENDEIIEVGAVKFRGETVLETFQSFVNPHRRLSEFIKDYTGIAQRDVAKAPPFGQVAAKLAPFLGAAPIVGHNLSFDLGFLESKGLRLSNERCDTWDLAYVMLPRASEYSLHSLAAAMGIEHGRPHRAVSDAMATMGIFLALAEKALDLDVFMLAEMERMAGRSSWVLSRFLREAETHLVSDPRRSAREAAAGVMGIDVQGVRGRLGHAKPIRANKVTGEIDVDLVESMLRKDGLLWNALPGFEERHEQVEMARVVANAVNRGGSLLVEAGTGVGKSLAYLLPSVLYALKNNKRVVISTNTINLQEQLLNKDVPALIDALSDPPEANIGDLKYALLKGRANYLCLRRAAHLRNSDVLADGEARMLSKVLVWLLETGTGDRSELNLGRRGVAAPWDRLSAQGAVDCNGVNGVCFLRSARERAAAAHLVVVNHALLMTDLVAGGTLIPEHDVLIVDEAHHLEEQATRHLGFELGQSSVHDHVQSLAGDGGLLRETVAAFRGSSAAPGRRETVAGIATEATVALPRVREAVAATFGLLSGIVKEAAGGGRRASRELRITRATRRQPEWSRLEIQWESLDAVLAELRSQLSALLTALDGLEEAGLVDYEGLLSEVGNAVQLNDEIRNRMAEFIPTPQADAVYWVTLHERTGELTLHAAPLRVGEHLQEKLFSKRDTVILTSATLSTHGSFRYVREQTGLPDADELLLGSPFDFAAAARLCVPTDIPEPSSWAYQAAIEQAVADAALAAGGRTMALFTSYASLNEAAASIRGNLRAHGLDVLAQGADGTPHQVLNRFLKTPESVLLGTASFWEGVDLAGESLKVLVVTRLPFNVPSEPVFAARSELYEDPFNEYAVPQAILRLRQGFGRLIRTKQDRGVVLILDRRILSRSYGKAFLESLPSVSVASCGLSDLQDTIRDWNGG